MAKKVTLPTLPKRIYAAFDGDPDSILADETIEPFDDGEKVGIYQLVEIKTKKVKEELV